MAKPTEGTEIAQNSIPKNSKTTFCLRIIDRLVFKMKLFRTLSCLPFVKRGQLLIT